MTDAVLRVSGATKNFGGVRALHNASLTLYAGEIHALLGENGAGKSTLLKTLAGVHRLDAGEIILDGKKFHEGSTRLAREQGVAVIYQEPNLFPDLTLAENVFAGRQKVNGKIVDWVGMQTEAQTLFDQLGVPLNPRSRARGLSIADQQIVEIAKALSLNAKVIVMDEPTAALSSKEVERLFNVARALAKRGAAVVFVSHRLDEVFELTDRLTVMRDGATVGTGITLDTTEADVIHLMVGREVSELFPKGFHPIGDVVLSLKNLAHDGLFENISFDVRAGEIVALAGLVGSGRSEIARAIFGVEKYSHGTITMLGKELAAGSPSKAMAVGIALVPEDRRLQGLFMAASIAKNSSVTILNRIKKGFLVRSKDEAEIAKTWGETLELKYADINDPVERLSGGNQQKVVLAKWLASQPALLIVDEPTRGIDVGTKAQVHKLLSDEAGKGLAVLMISSELPEVLGMADRILVMREGLMVKEFSRAEATSANVIAAATGAVTV
jgi:rhamnose transport system ATP-binding protein